MFSSNTAVSRIRERLESSFCPGRRACNASQQSPYLRCIDANGLLAEKSSISADSSSLDHKQEAPTVRQEKFPVIVTRWIESILRDVPWRDSFWQNDATWRARLIMIFRNRILELSRVHHFYAPGLHRGTGGDASRFPFHGPWA